MGPMLSAPSPQPATLALLLTLAVAVPASAQDSAPADDVRAAWEIHLGLGFGDAVGCDADEEDTSMAGAMGGTMGGSGDEGGDGCWIDGASAISLGGGYRLHSNWSLGLELGGWSFNVPEDWRGDLDGEATDVSVGMTYLAFYGRYYWFDDGAWDPYLQAGVGLGSITGTAENTNADFEISVSGPVYHVGIGVDYMVHPIFHLGIQGAAALLVGSEICTDDGDTHECRDPEKKDDGEREGLALPWRLSLTGTFVFGER